MVSFELTTIAGWIWSLLIDVFGMPVLAGIVGFVLIIIFGIRMGLGFDGLIVLGIFSGVLFSRFFLPIDMGTLFVLAVSIGIVSLAFLRMTRH